jgi:hypothetical protein
MFHRENTAASHRKKSTKPAASGLAGRDRIVRAAAMNTRRMWIEAFEPRLLMSTYTVTNLNASGAGSLADAVTSAVSAGGSSDIVFQSNLAGTITESTPDTNAAATGAGPSAFVIENNASITIDGADGGSGLTLDGGSAMRLFYIGSGSTLSINDLTLADGISQGGNGAAGTGTGGGGGAGLGGAIFDNGGSLVLQRSTLKGNTAEGGNGGAGQYLTGTGGGGGGLGGGNGVTSGNGGGFNGGLYPGGNGGFGGGGGASLTSTGGGGAGGNGGFGGGAGGTSTGNGTPATAGFGGGGSFTGAAGFGAGSGAAAGGGGAGMGGAIFNDAGTVTLENSTLTSNTAQGGTGGHSGSGLGGAVFNYNGTLDVTNVTISGNTATGGRGIYNLGDAGTATAVLNNTIIGQSSTSVTDFVGNTINGGTSTTSGVGNLIRSQSGFAGTVVSNADPLLGSLASNGGDTQTLLPASNSPVIDAGSIGAIGGATTDQLGDPRTIGGNVDIGSIEVISSPVVTGNPTSVTVNTGGNTSFTSIAAGSPAPTEQWQISTDGGSTFTNITNGGVYSGATTATLTITGAAAGMNGDEYQDVYTNSQGTATTTTATLTVDVAPAVTTNPGSVTINPGSNTSFTVAATGNPLPTVQWQVSTDGGATFSNLTDTGIYTGVSTDVLTLTNATLTENGYEYQAVFSNTLFGASSPSTTTTTAATLTLSAAPVVGVEPTSATINAGGNATFLSSAIGSPTPTEQWQVSTDGGATFTNVTNGGVYSGATTTTLSISSGIAAMNGNEYRDVFTNGNGNTSTNPATLTVDFAPTITTNPTNQTINAGGTASFTVAAAGNPAPAVQWQVSTDGGATFNNLTNTGIYSGATSDTLTVAGATQAENGDRYQAVFSNALLGAGSSSTATTTPATLAVGTPVITVSAYAQLVSSASHTGTLHVQAEQDGTDANLSYTWSIVSQPTVTASSEHQFGSEYVSSSAPLAIFAINGTNSAQNTPVTFLASGEYTLQVVASNGTQSVTSQVQVTAKVNPKVTPVALTQTTTVSGVKPVGTAQSITGFVVTFNGPVDPTTAQNALGYRVQRQYTVSQGKSFWQQLFGGSAGTQTRYSGYKIASAVYDSQTYSVALTLASPMPVVDGVRLVDVMGTGAHAVLDANGKAIDGDANGKAGGNFTYRFAMSVAKTLSYQTTAGDHVKLALSGPGKIVAIMPSNTATPMISLTGTSSSDSILTGQLRKGRKSPGYAVIDQLNDPSGADIQLGDEVHVNLYNSGQAI